VRVVSLVPSVTETLLAWGVEVAACTRFCEQPALVHVGGTKDPDLEAIVALAPDLVVVDREENRREDAESLIASGLAVHVTHVTDIEGVPTMLTALGHAVQRPIAPIAPEAPADAPQTDEPEWASAVTLIWRRPWMCIADATYGSSVLRRLGVSNVVDDVPNAYPEVTLEEIAERSPTFVILPSEPYPFAERHVAEVLAGVPRAVPVLVDGRDLFWWGQRTHGAVGRLRAVLRAASPPS
jgi:ABC-type Fe3+-hydroxamate transport system substrate-binding protein